MFSFYFVLFYFFVEDILLFCWLICMLASWLVGWLVGWLGSRLFFIVAADFIFSLAIIL